MIFTLGELNRFTNVVEVVVGAPVGTLLPPEPINARTSAAPLTRILGYRRFRTSPISKAELALKAVKPVGALRAHWPCSFAVVQSQRSLFHRHTCAKGTTASVTSEGVRTVPRHVGSFN